MRKTRERGAKLSKGFAPLSFKYGSRHLSDRLSKGVISILGISSFFALIFIAVFIFKEAFPAFAELGLKLFGTKWAPEREEFGILTLIVGSVAVTGLAVAIALPLSLGCAIYFSELASPRFYRLARPAVELLAGIPSVVYGLVGMTFVGGIISRIGGSSGSCLLAGGIVLAAMILPTIATISEDSIKAVPLSYKEASYALGATRWQTIRHVILPAARPGIIAGVVLGLGRAIGEAMAMIMVLGNSPIFPSSLLDPVRTLAGSIAIELPTAYGLWENAVFAIAAILFLLIMFFNSFSYFIYRRGLIR